MRTSNQESQGQSGLLSTLSASSFFSSAARGLSLLFTGVLTRHDQIKLQTGILEDCFLFVDCRICMQIVRALRHKAVAA